MRLNPRLQGDLGERSAMLWFGAQGAAVFTPVFHSPDYDLIADWGEGLIQVQVKTSRCFVVGGGRSRSVPAAATKAGAGWSNGSIPRTTTTCSSLSEMADGGSFPPTRCGAAAVFTLAAPSTLAYEIDPDRPLVELSADGFRTALRR